jgi:hypothetical protein
VISEQKFFYEMLSNEFPFRLICVFCSSLISSPNLNAISKFEKMNFYGMERMMMTFESLFLNNRQNSIDCPEFCSESFDMSESRFSNVSMSHCCDSDSLIEMKMICETEVGGNEWNLLLKDQESEENDFFLDVN